MGFTYTDLYTVSALPESIIGFWQQHLPTYKLWPSKGTWCHLTIVTLRGRVLDGHLGSSRGEVFHIIWGLLQGYGWLKEVGGHGNCIKEPANVTSSVVRMHKASTAPVAWQLVDWSLGAEADGPLYRRPLCCLHINLMDGQRSFSQWWRPFTEYSIFPKVS